MNAGIPECDAAQEMAHFVQDVSLVGLCRRDVVAVRTSVLLARELSPAADPARAIAALSSGAVKSAVGCRENLVEVVAGLVQGVADGLRRCPLDDAILCHADAGAIVTRSSLQAAMECGADPAPVMEGIRAGLESVCAVAESSPGQVVTTMPG
jgi:hypothetical protein